MAESNKGRIVQVIGPVLDIKFEEGSLPNLLNAIVIDNHGKKLVAETAQHIGDDIIRCIAMASTDGLVRGMEAIDTGNPISVPVGEETLGRLFNVLGKTIDNGEKIEAKKVMPIHRAAPSFEEQETATEIFETGIKVINML